MNEYLRWTLQLFDRVRERKISKSEAYHFLVIRYIELKVVYKREKLIVRLCEKAVETLHCEVDITSCKISFDF